MVQFDCKLILAFDFGEKKIGIASGNLYTKTASPITTLEYDEKIPWNKIKVIISEWSPDKIIIGIPEQKSDSTIVNKCYKFKKDIEIRFKLPVNTTDESFTSVEAKSILRNHRKIGIKKKRIKKKDIDSYSARLIAEQWMMYE
jgi:putative Holliday junction resolvase|tara:strand:+ start:10215 stop:10643 length:429 start_codon:yes stop_codon:yes gene_type:complete